MGLFSFMKSQYIDVIEWTDTPSRTIVHHFPSANQYIKMGAALIVRESQVAVIVNAGKVADVFEAGKYIMSQSNLSILSAQRLWKVGFKSPFKVDIYYVTTKQFTHLNWETVNPISVKSDDLGDFLTKVNGTFAFRVVNADKFMKGIFGTNQIYDTSYIIGQLKSKLIVGLTHLLNSTKLTVQDFTSHYDELSENTENKLQEQFALHGLELCSFIIESIHLPDHLRSKMIRDQVAEVNLTKCHECGHPMTIAMKFCSDCGVKV